MPSQRKRIGYLPNKEVHKIIEEISKQHKFSQSKVTGILVEEALRYRGILENSMQNSSDNSSDATLSDYFDVSNFIDNNYNISQKRKKNLEEDIKMINDFIEFKFFKKIMIQNNKLMD